MNYPRGEGTINIRESRPSYFKNLDALRFFSFLGVFISHVGLIHDTGNIFIDGLLKMLSFDYLGVPFFFSLSSFLITYRLMTEKERIGEVRLLKYYRNRILRIWPAYWIVVIICFLLLPLAVSVLGAKGPTLPSFWPFALFYVNFYIIHSGSDFTFALLILWSISIEEQFYLVWGIFIKFISRYVTGFLILLLFGLSVAFSYYYLHVHPGSENLLAIHSLFVLQNFCAGALAAWVYLTGKGGRVPKKISALLFASIYVILPFCYLLNPGFVMLSIVKSVCFGLILYDQSFNERRIFNVGRFALLNYLGKISYGLYVYHALIMVLLQTQFGFFTADTPSSTGYRLIQGLVALLITVIVSHVSYRYVESKFLAMKTA
ncbi:MAG: acyltransferase [Chitinophagaceae bacterium]|nr:acyltransferase [Chitinophagaceae bacterium]